MVLEQSRLIRGECKRIDQRFDASGKSRKSWG